MSTHTGDWTKPADGSFCDWCGEWGAPHDICELHRARCASLLGQAPTDEQEARHGYAIRRRRKDSRAVTQAGQGSEDAYRFAGAGMTRARGPRD